MWRRSGDMAIVMEKAETTRSREDAKGMPTAVENPPGRVRAPAASRSDAPRQRRASRAAAAPNASASSSYERWRGAGSYVHVTITSSSSASRARELGQPCRDVARRPDERLPAQRLDDGAAPAASYGCAAGDFRRQQRVADAALEADAPVFARVQLAPRLLLGVGRERPHADRRLRLRMRGARPVVVAVEAQRLLDAAPVAEEVRERVRQAEMRGEARAVVRAAEDPQFRPRGAGRMRADAALTDGRPAGSRRTATRRRSCTCCGNSSAAFACGLSAYAVRRSVPGARPTPRSMRPGAIASSTRNCSATLSAA